MQHKHPQENVLIGILFWFFVGLILYTYAGYPLILAGLAHLRPQPRPYPASTPDVTVLISAYKEEDFIAQKLENTLSLDYPRDRLQILVAADGSEDSTADIVRTFADLGVELDHTPVRRGKLNAISQAIGRARGEVVVLSDANNLYPADYLRAIVAPFADPAVGAVTGAKHILPDDGILSQAEGLYWQYESFIKEKETRLGCCTAVSGEVLAIRRQLFEPFSKDMIVDDFPMAMRIVKKGYRLIYVPEARSFERVSISARDEIARRARNVAGRFQSLVLAAELLPLDNPVVVWQVVSHKFMRLFVPIAMIGAFLTNWAAVIWPLRLSQLGWLFLSPPFNWLLLVAQLLFYGIAWIGEVWKWPGVFGKLFYLPRYLVASNFAGLIGLYRFAARRQTSHWQRVQRPHIQNGDL